MMVKCFDTTRRQGPPKRKFQARNLAHESVDFVDQNALNLRNAASVNSKIFRGYIISSPDESWGILKEINRNFYAKIELQCCTL
jgi:hypothetical protein